MHREATHKSNSFFFEKWQKGFLIVRGHIVDACVLTATLWFGYVYFNFHIRFHQRLIYHSCGINASLNKIK